MSLYRWLDPLWSCFPFPYKPYFREERMGPVYALDMGRLFFGKKMMTVRTYMYGDTIVDTGISCMAHRVARLSQERGIRKALITHHHEDHSGNASALQAEGIDVHSSQQTQVILKEGFPLRFYQHLMWGKAPPCQTHALPQETQLGPHTAQVIEAPGHCDDQVVFYVPSEGWLFSGDAFLHERVRMFRRDEDFYKTLSSLEHILTLDFDALFCAHRPKLTGGKQALAQKLAWFKELEGNIKDLHQKGLTTKEIGAQLFPSKQRFPINITLGDVSGTNMVRAVLEGAKVRPEIQKLTDKGR